jgi:ssDNA-binding Zn-finger/Zn-ribbon topoisomerase 1
MGEFADDALDREIDDWVRDDDEYSSDHPYYVKVPDPKAGDKCNRVGCPGVLVERTNSTTGDKFLGCSMFPKCKRSYSIDFWKKHKI